MTRKRSFGFVAAALVAAAATTAICCGEAFGLSSRQIVPFGATSRPLDVLDTAKPWLTAVPGGAQSLRGKVVIVNFWTYSCINSLRALPYLKAWSERYGDKGLVVVGVHAPEFQFEHDPAKVRLATRQLGVRYPNVQDNDYAVWQQFANQGWPGFYFIDAKGRVRGYRIGEGDYAGGEQLIRTLLAESGHDPSAIPVASIAGTGIEAAADWANLRSPEAYLGYGKAADFRSPGGLRRDVSVSYAAAADVTLNSWDLAGKWKVGREYATLDGAAGAIRFRFHARDAHLVLGGAPDGRPIRFRVTLDGAAPGASHGADSDAQGWGEVREDRLYQLVRQKGAIGDRTVTIEFSRPGVRAYVFTFG
ncbi:redoxin domain-containing protein [Sphingomonas lycopersici]|uniref:Redoxin domain-containing protein n=1 Tax=Sphingomonas lycopersici TaxID=2951807 RepID=A0AA41ZDG3_9SPHN|nr:redoxin domain-containing protein [Sphingomonas lycopersici]MCW6537638.1 redoxin domain-containing protein [Sphingomonas lycopersici]